MKTIFASILFCFCATLASGQSYVLLESEIGCHDSIPLDEFHLSLQVDTVKMEIGWLCWELDVSVLCGSSPGFEVRYIGIHNDGFPIYLKNGNAIRFQSRCGLMLKKLLPLKEGFYLQDLLDLIHTQAQLPLAQSQFRVFGNYFDPAKKEIVSGMFEVRAKAVIDPKEIDALDFDRLW